MNPQGAEVPKHKEQSEVAAASDLSRIRELLLPDLGEFEKVEMMIEAIRTQQKQNEHKLAEATQHISILNEQVLRLERQNASLSKHVRQIEERQSGLLSRFGKKIARRD